ncbi:LysE family translocator [Brevundimonas sp. 2R-24]|uniref:LysE family translocator n=1 Tax=Peiella sedimenti TaxID=3061083 RepID=A0ABT8SK46_9CAUL|nr:LysE family translocator [Caulobacteraceae bacterium XZ-24]
MIPHEAWPVDPAVLPAFLAAVALIELTPGPNMTWLAIASAQRGRRAGLAAVAGVTLGLAAWMLAAAFGLTELLLAAPSLYQAVRWAGIAFLLWLAWEAWASEPGLTEVNGGAGRLFVRGLVGNLLNPKAAAFYAALLPGFIRPDHGAVLTQALTLGALHLMVAVLIHGLIVLGGAGAGMNLTRTLGSRRLRAVAALGIAAAAVWMAWQTRG